MQTPLPMPMFALCIFLRISYGVIHRHGLFDEIFLRRLWGYLNTTPIYGDESIHYVQLGKWAFIAFNLSETLEAEFPAAYAFLDTWTDGLVFDIYQGPFSNNVEITWQLRIVWITSVLTAVLKHPDLLTSGLIWFGLYPHTKFAIMIHSINLMVCSLNFWVAIIASVVFLCVAYLWYVTCSKYTTQISTLVGALMDIFCDTNNTVENGNTMENSVNIDDNKDTAENNDIDNARKENKDSPPILWYISVGVTITVAILKYWLS